MPSIAPAIVERYPSIQVSRLALREGNSKKPVYTMHKWWARRLGTIFRMLLIAEGRSPRGRTEKELWNAFYSPTQLPHDFTVLDPFLGGGTSLVEAAKLGAHCIGVDIDPVACFVTGMELANIDAELLRTEFSKIEKEVASKIRALYRSKVEGKVVDVIYNFWVDHITCPSCDATHDGHPTFQITHDVAAGTQLVVCVECGALTPTKLGYASCKCSSCSHRIAFDAPPVANGRFTCPDCGESQALHELYCKGLVTQRMFAKEFLRSDGERDFARTSRADNNLYERATKLYAKSAGTLPIPKSPIPIKGRTDRRPLLYGYTHYHEMFNDRQLYCLGLIAAEIQRIDERTVRQALALAFSQSLATNNMFCGYAFGYRRLTPLFGVHSFRKISRPVEGNVWGLPLGRGSFHNTVRSVLLGAEYMRTPYEFSYEKTSSPKRIPVGIVERHATRAPKPARSVRILNQSSADLGNIADETVDLILTDPPYFDNISYSELSDFYHVWLRELLKKDYCGFSQHHTPLAGALYAGRRRRDGSVGDPRKVYEKSLSKIFRECHRVTKDNAKLIFTFHHRSSTAWSSLGKSLLKSGFQVRKVFPVRSEGQSGFHSYEGSLKWDSIFICRKGTAKKLSKPSDQLLQNIAKAAIARATAWRKKIRQSQLTFGEADELSLQCSFVVREFSRRKLLPGKLAICMAQLREPT